jgi:hypothetical protein
MMQLHGSTEGNLIAAVRSATRFRDHPVHSDTIRHWENLLHHARRELSDSAALPSESLQRLVMDLEIELAKRPA